MTTSSCPTSVSAALAKAEPTGAKLSRAFGQKIDWAKVERLGRAGHKATVPGLDVAALRRRYRPDRGAWPRAHEATFRVPTDVADAQYAQRRKLAIGQFLGEMDRRGWDVYTDATHRPRVYPGVYPARDLLSGAVLVGQREMIVRIWFRLRAPKVERTEIPPHLLKART